MNGTVEEFKKQHLENYKKAVYELLKNNSTVLVDEDIMLLLKKPPLDSMDVIKSKFLDLAKKQKIILDDIKLNKIIDDYRKDVIKVGDEIKKKRISFLEKIIMNFDPVKENEVIKFNKKDFIAPNKEIRKIIKTQVLSSIDKKIVKNVKQIFTEDTDDAVCKKVENEALKFLTKSYVKQLLDNVDFKLLVKDTILSNAAKEHGERYLFTKMNSHLLNDKQLNS